MIQDAGHWRRRYAVAGNYFQGLEEKRIAEKSEDRTGCIGQKDTVGIVTTCSGKGYN